MNNKVECEVKYNILFITHPINITKTFMIKYLHKANPKLPGYFQNGLSESEITGLMLKRLILVSGIYTLILL